METLVLVMSLLGCVPSSERHALVVDAAVSAGLCGDGVACEDEWSSVYDLVAESGVDVSTSCGADR